MSFTVTHIQDDSRWRYFPDFCSSRAPLSVLMISLWGGARLTVNHSSVHSNWSGCHRVTERPTPNMMMSSLTLLNQARWKWPRNMYDSNKVNADSFCIKSQGRLHEVPTGGRLVWCEFHSRVWSLGINEQKALTPTCLLMITCIRIHCKHGMSLY